MKQLFVYVILSVSIILLYGCNNSNVKNPIGILRQFTGLESGVKKAEYHLCLTQEEIDDLLSKKDDELGYLPPIQGFPKISNNEICLFIFMGEYNTDALFAEVIEEQNRIIFRVFVPSYQWIVKSNLTRNGSDSPKNADKTDNSKISNTSIKKIPTPFGYFVLPRTNKKIVIQKNLPPYTKEETNWQAVKEFNPR